MADLLKEIQDRFKYLEECWREVRSQGAKDMKCLAGDPWDPKERKAREDANRPCLAMDELNQYINQCVNDWRMKKRAIQVTAVGAGANDQTAEVRQGIIRQIEYKSNAQTAYATAFEDAVSRSYGFLRVTTKYVSDDSFDQELVIERIPNPDSVYLDWDAKEADFSDMADGFVVDAIPKDRYKELYPKAKIHDFTAEHIVQFPQWIYDNKVQVAEYWKVEKNTRELGLFECTTKDGQSTFESIFDDEMETPDVQQFLKQFKSVEVKRTRDVEAKNVREYLTNGIEILEERDWLGKWIPIIPILGKEMYVDFGGGAKRVLISMTRLARDPYMLYCYYRTSEAELVSMTPKTPWLAYEGQISPNHMEAWQNANRVPVTVLYATAKTEATGNDILPLPTRPAYVPQIEPLEIGAEAARRGIQAAMGIAPLPTPAQKQNEKSGVAIQRIESAEDVGSFHFTNNGEHSIEHTGRILNDLLDKIYDTPREVGVRNDDETFETVKINQEFVDEETGETKNNDLSEGDHDVTISVGPSFASQREQANDFLTTMSQIPEVMQVAGDIIVKAQDIGPMGDELADRLKPAQFRDQNDTQQAQVQLAQMSQQHQQLVQIVTQLQQEKQSRVLEIQSKEKIAAAEFQLKQYQIDEENKLKREIAHITASKDANKAQADRAYDSFMEMSDNAHEIAMQKDQQGHDAQMAQQQAQVAAQQQQQSQAHDANMAAQQQAAQQEQAGAEQ